MLSTDFTDGGKYTKKVSIWRKGFYHEDSACGHRRLGYKLTQALSVSDHDITVADPIVGGLKK
jgi:hypothetical protein